MTGPVTTEALVAALREANERFAKAEIALQQVTAERDEAREERDALKQAAGFNPGPFRTELSRKVVLEDIAGMRPAMVKARRHADQNEGDALLWTMRMLEEWPGDTLLLRLWRQRKEATKAARTAEASLATATSELARLRAEGEAKDRRIAALEAALAPFAKAGGLFGPRQSNGWDVLIYNPAAGEEYCITADHLRAARAATAREGA